MRLTCPNCGAQYEVPEEVIPPEGRDVQCSNCGDTWYQTHGQPPEPEDTVDTAPRGPEPDSDDLRAALHGTEPKRKQAKATDDDEDEDSVDHGRPDKGDQGKRNLDPSVTDVLRQEAEHEAQLRAAEKDSSLESQPDLGLDNMPDEPARRAREARDRMARMRGENPAPVDDPADSASRRGLLPDIEEINSTLRSTSDNPVPRTEVSRVRAETKRKKKGSFRRGFALAIILIVLLTLTYANAPKIAETVPQAGPALNIYVDWVDQGRIWLDAKLGSFVPR